MKVEPNDLNQTKLKQVIVYFVFVGQWNQFHKMAPQKLNERIMLKWG